jgi:hypothetical protein
VCQWKKSCKIWWFELLIWRRGLWKLVVPVIIAVLETACRISGAFVFKMGEERFLAEAKQAVNQGAKAPVFLRDFMWKRTV